jgi:hypothetical protein
VDASVEEDPAAALETPVGAAADAAVLGAAGPLAVAAAPEPELLPHAAVTTMTRAVPAPTAHLRYSLFPTTRPAISVSSKDTCR